MPALDLAADLLTRNTTLAPAAASLALLAGAFLTRRVAARRWTGGAAGPANAAARRRLRWLRGACALLLVLGLGMLWRGEIQALAFQVAALTMAIVMAFRELILCATGSLLRVGGRLYRIGDLVELDGTLGEVTDTTLFVTHVAEMEVDSFGRRATGRSRAVPNSRLFTAELRVDRLEHDFLFHRFSITLPADADVPQALAVLERAALAATTGFAAQGAAVRRSGARHLHQALEEEGARVALATTEIGLPRFDLLLFCPAGAVHDAERGIRLALAHALAKRPARPAAAVEGLRLVAG